MSDTKVTPSSLYAHDDSFINKEGKRVGVVRITDSSESCGKWIGEVPPYGKETGNFPDHEEAIVYASLFAAAPDLLIVAAEALDFIKAHNNYVAADIIDKLQTAIAKATGN